MNKLKNKYYQGFSLIEILVVVILFGGVGLLATNSLFSLLRGASKTEILKEVKQNGDYAISVMELKIRNAENITSTCAQSGTIASSIQILNSDGATHTTYSCDTSTTNRIREETTLVSDGSVVSSNLLTNTSVELPSCLTSDISFTCTTSANGLKTVAIQFTLNQAKNVSIAEQVSETFRTQVVVRNTEI